jgi:hypothetical protein
MFCCGRLRGCLAIFFTKKVEDRASSPIVSNYNLRWRKQVNYSDTSDDEEVSTQSSDE